MCGIVGIIEAEPRRAASDTERLIRAMTRTLAHRGPDDEGTVVMPNGSCALGHRRLSIQDLSQAGHQPMRSADGRFTLVYNGEIYNAAELRAELDGPFRGHSDTEVLLEALVAWGPDRTLAAVNGMFAFALYDAERERLLVARDRFGQKPLYVARLDDGDVAFASEARALLVHPGFRAEIDPVSVAAYFEHGAVPGRRAVFKGVEKLVPGTYAVFARDHGRVREVDRSAYFSLVDAMEGRAKHDVPTTLDDAADHLHAALGDAVERRLISDVPVGAFLSGGVDSAAVVALMKERARGDVRTFTIGFSGTEHDEAPAATRLAEALGTVHTVLEVTPNDVITLASNIASVYDEPFADPSEVPTTLLCRLTREHVTVALSGDAADELLGGYRRYTWAREVWRYLERAPAPARKMVDRVLERLPTGSIRAPARVANALAERAGIPEHVLRYVDEDGLRKLAAFAGAPSRAELYHRFRSVWPRGECPVRNAEAPLRDTGYLELAWPEGMLLDDLAGYLPDDILVKVDRASMSAGLEVRCPFLDPEVAQLALSLPLELRLPERGATHGGDNKPVLRRLLSRFVSEDLVAEQKRGFTLPIDTWLRGPLRDWADALLDKSRLVDEGWLDAKAVRRRWDSHLTGVRDFDDELWAVLMFESWLEGTLGGARAERVSA